MDCPRCNRVRLKATRLQQVDVRVLLCASCNGFLVESSQLSKLFGTDVSKDFQVPGYAFTSINAPCPVCNNSLLQFCYPVSSIHIDACKQCHLIWLDEMEFADIRQVIANTKIVQCKHCKNNNRVDKSVGEKVACTFCGVLMVASKPRDIESENSETIPPEEENSDSAELGLSYEWDQVRDMDVEYKQCLMAIPIMLLIATFFNVSDFGQQLQRIWLTMPVHEFGHAVTAWMTGYNAIPSLWETRVFAKGFIGPLVFLGTFIYMARYAISNNSIVGLFWCVVAITMQIAGTFIVSDQTALMLVTFGGDGMGMILASVLIVIFFYGKETQLYLGSLRWGFLVIGAAAFVDMYSVWWRCRDEISNVPYGTTGGNFTDSYKLVEKYGWSFQELVSRHFVLGNVCLLFILIFYVLGVLKAKRILESRNARNIEK